MKKFLILMISLLAGLSLAAQARARAGRWDNDGYLRHDSMTPAPSIPAGGAALSSFEDPDNDGRPGADMDGADEVVVGKDNCTSESLGGTVGTTVFFNTTFGGSGYVCEDGILTDFSGVGDLIPINRALPDIRFDFNLSIFPYWDDLTRQAGTPREVRVTVATVADSTLYTVTIEGTDFSVMSDADATAQEIRDGLMAAINFGLTGEATATAFGTNAFTVAPDDPADNDFDLDAGTGLSAVQTVAGADRSIIRIRTDYVCGGNGSNLCTTIEWRGMALESDAGARLTFQLTLVNTGEVRFHYLDMVRASGTSATVGAQNSNGDSWNTYSYNTANTVMSGLVVSFHHDSDIDGLSDALEDVNQDGSVDTVDVAQVTNVSVDDVRDDTDYTLTINGAAFTIDSGTGATGTSIRDALIAAVNAGAQPVSAAAGGAGDLDLTADTAGTPFGFSVSANLDALTTTANANPETDPGDEDSDDDGEWDGGEMVGGTDPLDLASPATVVDGDADGLGSLTEAYFGTDDSLADSDGDGMSDLDELNWGNPPRDPAFADSDQDGQPDGFSRPSLDVTVNTVSNNSLYTVTINGTAYHFTSDGSATDAEIRDGLGFFLEKAGFNLSFPASDTLTVQGNDEAVTTFTAMASGNLTVMVNDNVSESFDDDPRDPTDLHNDSFSTNNTVDVGTGVLDNDGNVHFFGSNQNGGSGLYYVMLDRWGVNELISSTDLSDELPNDNNGVKNARAFLIPGSDAILVAVRYDTGSGDGLGLLRVEPGLDDRNGNSADPERIVTISAMVVASSAHEFDLFVDASGVAHLVYELWFGTSSGGREDVGYELRYLRADARTGRVLSDVSFHTEPGGDGVHKKGRPHVVVSGGVATILFKIRDKGAHIVRMSGATKLSGPTLAHAPGEHEDLAFAGGALLSGAAGGETKHYPRTPAFLVSVLNPGGGVSVANVIDERFDSGNTHVEALSVGTDRVLFSWYDDDSGEFRWVMVDRAGNLVGMPMVKDEGNVGNNKGLYNSTDYRNGKILSVSPSNSTNFAVQVRNAPALPSAFPLAPTTRQNILTALVSAVTNPATGFGAGGGGDSGGCVIAAGSAGGTGGVELLLMAGLVLLVMERRRRSRA